MARFLVAAAAAVARRLVVPTSAFGRGGQLPRSERLTIGMLGVGNRRSSVLGAMRPWTTPGT